MSLRNGEGKRMRRFRASTTNEGMPKEFRRTRCKVGVENRKQMTNGMVADQPYFKERDTRCQTNCVFIYST